jgi:hypothetical protein
MKLEGKKILITAAARASGSNSPAASATPIRSSSPDATIRR